MDAASRQEQIVSDRKKFQESLPKIIDQVTSPQCGQTKDAIEHFRQVCISVLFAMFID
jgi:hypothetical protein